MFTKCESLRWILVDEGSSASCENLGIMESNVRTNMREAADTYKMRPKTKGSPTEPRAWGGVNLLLFTDMWQLPPVRQIALFDKPFTQTDHRVQRIMGMVWSKDIDGINKFIELTQAKRQKEGDWFFQFIQQCRNGVQSEEMYNFIHGASFFVGGPSDLSCGDPGTRG